MNSSFEIQDNHDEEPRAMYFRGIMPHNIEAEQGLLGALLIENSAFYDAYGTVKKEDFFFPAHELIFEKIHERVDEGKVASPITLKSYFENNEDLKDIGGAGYLADLAGNVISVVNVEDYAQTIYGLAERRRLLSAVESAHETLMDPNTDPSVVRADISHAVENSGKSIFVKTKKQVAAEAVEALQMPKKCYPTGLAALDKAMAGGFYAGFTYGLCGAEKRGKTTFAHTISENLNNAGVDHAYIALEMGSAQIEQRNIARCIGVNSMAFLQEKKSQDLLRKAADHSISVKDHTLYLDMPGCSFAQIKAELSALVAKKKIKGFILDYWQLVGGCPAKQTKADFLYDVAQWAANFSKRHGIWCVLLSQVNREGKVFGSAGLEKACDQMYFIERCENFSEAMLYLNLSHSRYTPTGQVGSDTQPKFTIETKAGPYIEEVP